MDQKNKKILLLFYEPHKSGISRHIRYLFQILQDTNLEFWLLCSSNDQKIISFFSDVIAKERLTRVSPSRFFSVDGFFMARKLIQENDIDQVHIHNLQSALWGYSSTVLSKCKKTIFTPHVDSIAGDSGCFWSRYFFKALDPFTTSFIAVSQSQQNRFHRWKIGKESKIKCISNHINADEILSSAHLHSHSIDKLNLPPSTILVMQVGRLDRQKNPFFLLRVIKQLVKKCDNSHFLFVGTGPLRKKMENQIQKDNLSSHVTLLGYQKDMYQLLAAVHIITSTSGWEGLPYSLIEASFFKKAIVATDIPGHSDLITSGQSGFLTSNEGEFAEKLHALIYSGKLRAEMGENCYKRNEKLFNIENMRAALSRIYMDS